MRGAGREWKPGGVGTHLPSLCWADGPAARLDDGRTGQDRQDGTMHGS
jgi:hypothetical protein